MAGLRGVWFVNKMGKKRGDIYLWTGSGWGKTTSAFGVALRALGHGYKVVVVQFMKGRKEEIGEYKIQKKLKNLEVKQFGRKEWVNLKKPGLEDKKLAQQGLAYAKKAARSKPFLLVLDEINLAAKIGLLGKKEVLDFLDSIDEKVHVYLTGRHAPRYLLERADYVNVITPTKGAKRLVGEKGIDY